MKTITRIMIVVVVAATMAMAIAYGDNNKNAPCYKMFRWAEQLVAEYIAEPVAQEVFEPVIF